MFDLEPATTTMSGLVAGVTDDQLAAPTPCREMPIGTLLDHIAGLSGAFTAAATKQAIQQGRQVPSADAARLPADWRTTIPQ